MEPGQIWAYRERSSDPNCPFVSAEIVQFGPPRSQKVRVRWIGGEYPGLEAWIPRGRLCVEWEHAEAWLRDERLYEQVRVASLEALDSVEHRAALLVISVHPVPDGILPGYDRGDGASVRVRPWPSAVSDLAVDIEELAGAPLAFVDRDGTYCAPWPVTLRLARAVAARYTEEVLRKVAVEEAELQDRVVHGWTITWGRGAKQTSTWVPPERCVEALQEQQPIFDLVRAWCGIEATERFDRSAGLAAEVARLRKLVEEAVRRLEAAGMKYDARFLRRELDAPETKSTR